MKLNVGIFDPKTQEIHYIPYRGAPVKAPEGMEWAQASLDHFHEGAEKLRIAQTGRIGTSVLLEGFAKKGVVIIMPPGALEPTMLGAFGGIGAKGDESVPALDFTSLLQDVPPHLQRQVADLKLVPAIFLNDTTYAKHPENAAYLLGYELGDYYNIPPDKLAEYTLVKTLTRREPQDLSYSMHSANHLFALGAQMDSVSAQNAKKKDQALPLFTQRRLMTLSTPENAATFPRHIFADSLGLLLCDASPTMPNNPSAADHQFPVLSEVVKKYVQTVVLLDAAYRSTGIVSPKEKREYAAFKDKVFSPTGGLKPEDFRQLQLLNRSLYEKGGVAKDADLKKASDLLLGQIATFEGELQQLAGNLKRQRLN